MKIILPLLFAVLLLIPLVSAQVPDLKSFSSVFQTIDTVFLVLIIIYIVIDVYKIIRLYRKEGAVFTKFFSKAKAILAIAISLAGVVVFIIAMFQPWYKIRADVVAGQFNTGGLKDIISIDGVNGVNVDKTLIGGLELPKQGSLNTILFFIVLSTVFGLLGAKSLRSFGKGSIKSGIFTIVVVVAVILFAVFLPNIVDTLTSNVGLVKQNPIIEGQYFKNITVPLQAKVDIRWGWEIGMYLFILAAILKIIGGVLAMFASKEVDKKK